MNEPPAGLLLRLDPEDHDLRLLRHAIDRAGCTRPAWTFGTLFVDAGATVERSAMADLRAALERAGCLDADAEITWHGPIGPEDAVRALGATRRSLPRPDERAGSMGCVAVDFGGRDLQAAGLAERLCRLRRQGVVHLALGAGRSGDVRHFDGVAQIQGFRRYEAANWSLPGQEARWLRDARQGGAIMGLGPGAYGRQRAGRHWQWWRAGSGKRWRDAILAGRDGRGRLHALGNSERASERLIDGLRLAEGADLAGIEAEAGLPRCAWLDEPALTRALADGLLRMSSGRLCAIDLNRTDQLAEMLLAPHAGGHRRA